MLRYRALVVEDEKLWCDLFQSASATLDFAEFDYRKTADSARKAFAARPVHIASVDQNIPLVPNETATAEFGFELLEEVVLTRPFVRTLMYTVYGRPVYANRAGRLGGTEYFEKKAAEHQQDALDVSSFFDLLKALTIGGRRPDNNKEEKGYIHWALARARDHLPGMVGSAAGRLHDAQEGGFDSDKASKALAALIERTTELAWAQACALAATTKARPLRNLSAARDLSEFLLNLGVLWTALEDNGQLGVWSGYVTDSGRNGKWGEAGGRFTNAVTQLRNVRNRDTHGRIEALSPVDLKNAAGDILALIDGLAYWADRPLMYGVRLHPDDRSRLQFQKIINASSWPLEDVISNASPIKNADRRTSIQFLHRVSQSEQLVDLFPFVSMVEQAGKPPTPALLLPRPSGFIRRSLTTGEEIPNVALRGEERTAIKDFFGTGWRI